MSQVKKRKSACYCINLRRAANAVTGTYDKFLAPIGLTVNQFSLLKNLNCLETGSVSDLANLVGLERTTLVRTLKPLLDRGLIFDNSTACQRNRSLQLTQAGKKTIEQGLPLWESAQAEIENRIGKENINELCETLAILLGD